MRRSAVTTLVLALLAGASGCARFRNNLHNTLADAFDIVRFDLSFSLGTDMGAHFMVSELIQLKSYSYEDLYRLGIKMRTVGLWEEEREDWWIGPFHGDFRIKSDGVGVLTHGWPAKAASGVHFSRGLIGEAIDEIGAGIHLFVVGARAGVMPLELLDFLVCPTGLDLCRDNLSLEKRRALEQAKRKAAAAARRQAEAERDAPEEPEPPEAETPAEPEDRG